MEPSTQIKSENTKEIQIQEEKEIELKRRKKNNIRLYTPYKIVSWDLLFYYAIIYLFLVMEKGISPAEAMLFDAFYILFKFAMQIPCTLLIGKIGKRKSLLVANFTLAVHILIIILAPNFNVLLISQVLCAFSYVIKATCETDMLYDALEKGERRGSIFAKIDGRANSLYYYLDAITAIASGFLFTVNAYIPMIACFICLMIAFFLSTKFEEVEEKRKQVTILAEFKNLKIAFRNILKSKRLKNLLLFNGIFVALLRILQTLRNTSLTQIGMPEQYFGLIFAVLGIISGVAAKNQERIHKKYRNKTLAFLSMPTAISCLVIGLTLWIGAPNYMNIPILFALFAIQYIMKGPYYGLIKRYFNNFTNSEKRVKIATVNNLLENLIAGIILFVTSAILDKVPVAYTLVLVGCVFIIAVVLLLDHMRTKVGLKPEEYRKKRITINYEKNHKMV